MVGSSEEVMLAIIAKDTCMGRASSTASEYHLFVDGLGTGGARCIDRA
jgi:hypothetical protein